MTARPPAREAPSNPFPEEEFAGRRRQAEERLSHEGLGALLITTEPNFTYFTGIRTPSFASRSRPIILLLAPGREPVIVVAKSHVPHAQRSSGIGDVRPFDGFEAEGLAVASEVLQGLPAGSRVGCEFGNEMQIGLTHEGLHGWMAGNSGLHFVDASSLIWDLRLTKSPAEVDLLAEIGRITGTAYDALLNSARVGATLRELFEVFAATIIGAGADRVGYFAIYAGTGDDRRPNAPASGQRLAAGDVVWIDAGGVMHGYWSDFTRMFAMGDPGRARRDAYAFVHRTSRELLATIRPGITAKDVMAVCEAAFERDNRRIGNSTRIGHGLGLDITEPPSIFARDDRFLTAGMVLAIEPGVASDDGYFVVEENLAVVHDGIRLLSPAAPPELPVVG